MQINLSSICLRNVYNPQIKSQKEDNFKQVQTGQNLTLLPSYKASRTYAVINFGQSLPEDFSTIEGYKKLNLNQKEKLRENVKNDLRRNTIYCNDEGLSILENVTKEILNKFKNQRLVSLGRSPIPFLEMAKAMKNGISDYDFVAFSDAGFLYSINKASWQEDKSHPTMQQLDCYRQYLKTTEMDPETIIKKAEGGEKTVIIDFCFSGDSMRVFLEILRDWALEQNNYEELKNSVFVAPMHYSKNDFRNYSPTDFLNTDTFYFINNEYISTNLFKEFYTSPIDLLNADKNIDLYDIFEHRSNTYFEKPYPLKDWEKGFPTRGPESHPNNTNLAKFAIIDYLARNGKLRV